MNENQFRLRKKKQMRGQNFWSSVDNTIEKVGGVYRVKGSRKDRYSIMNQLWYDKALAVGWGVVVHGYIQKSTNVHIHTQTHINNTILTNAHSLLPPTQFHNTHLIHPQLSTYNNTYFVFIIRYSRKSEIVGLIFRRFYQLTCQKPTEFQATNILL